MASVDTNVFDGVSVSLRVIMLVLVFLMYILIFKDLLTSDNERLYFEVRNMPSKDQYFKPGADL